MLVEATYLPAPVVVPSLGCSFLNTWILCGIYISSCQEDDENYFSRIVEWLTRAPKPETAVRQADGRTTLRLGELSDCLDALAAGTAQEGLDNCLRRAHRAKPSCDEGPIQRFHRT